MRCCIRAEFREAQLNSVLLYTGAGVTGRSKRACKPPPPADQRGTPPWMDTAALCARHRRFGLSLTIRQGLGRLTQPRRVASLLLHRKVLLFAPLCSVKESNILHFTYILSKLRILCSVLVWFHEQENQHTQRVVKWEPQMLMSLRSSQVSSSPCKMRLTSRFFTIAR